MVKLPPLYLQGPMLLLMDCFWNTIMIKMGQLYYGFVNKFAGLPYVIKLENLLFLK